MEWNYFIISEVVVAVDRFVAEPAAVADTHSFDAGTFADTSCSFVADTCAEDTASYW